MPIPRTPAAIRLARLTQRNSPDECWPFMGSIKANGYGQLLPDRPADVVHSNGYAHRVAWEAAFGPIPEGETVDHTCHTAACRDGNACAHRRCVNPAHLALASRLDNYLRTARKDVCRNGHENPQRDERGHCLVCRGKTSRRAQRSTGRPEHPKRAEALAMLAAGMSQADVARTLSLGSQTVSRWANGRPDRSPHTGRVPAAVRAAVRERDEERCARCGGRGENAGGRGSLHHRMPRGRGSDGLASSYALSNLVVLCGSGTTGCHGWVESYRTQAEADGWLVRRGLQVPADVPVLYRGRWVLLDDEGGVTPWDTGAAGGPSG
jgi:5-methylcytosine-specific restriction protein A